MLTQIITAPPPVPGGPPKSLGGNIFSRRRWNQIWQLSIAGWIYLIVIWFLYRRVRFFNGVFAIQRSPLQQHVFADELSTR